MGGLPPDVGAREGARRWEPHVGYTPLDCLGYRAKSESWLRTEATNSFAEVKSSILLRKNPVSSLLVMSEVVVVAALPRGDAEGVAVAPPERDEQESEWADVLQGEMNDWGWSSIIGSSVAYCFPICSWEYMIIFDMLSSAVIPTLPYYSTVLRLIGSSTRKLAKLLCGRQIPGSEAEQKTGNKDALFISGDDERTKLLKIDVWGSWPNA